MSTHDHRSPRPPIAGARGRSGDRQLPAARPRRRTGRRCARRSGSRTARRAARATRSPSTTARTRRAPRRCSRSSPRADVRATFFLVGEQVRRNPALAPRDRRRRARDRRCTATATATCCASRRGRCARTSPVRRTTIEDATGRSPELVSPALRGAQRGRAAPRARARLAHAAVEPLGPRLGGARHARVDRRARRPTAPAEGRCCCCTTPTTTRRPDSWRRTAAALPARARDAAARARSRARLGRSEPARYAARRARHRSA